MNKWFINNLSVFICTAKRTKESRGAAAFSLVEALLAMTILGIAVTSILTTFSASIMTGKLSEDYSIASTLIGELHGNLRTNQFSPYDTNEGEFTTQSGFKWTVTYLYTDMTDLYQVEMKVMWKRGSRDHELKYTTYHYFSMAEDASSGGSSSKSSSSSSGR